MRADVQPTVVIQPRQGLFDLNLSALWQYRELFYFLVWRDVKVRYKQTVIGAGWAVLQPVTTMVIFTIVFGHLAKIPSQGVPYPIFVYTALLPWNYFAKSLERASVSLVENSHLISKVYFPRLTVPVAAIGTPLLDFAIAFGVLLAMMAWYRVTPTWGAVLLPFWLLFSMVTALAMSLFLSALHVRYRDVVHLIPFMTQIWMFASPVMYPVTVVPERWQLLYRLNPLANVIEGFRWALLGTAAPWPETVVVSAAAVVALLLGALIFFKNVEPTFADVI